MNQLIFLLYAALVTYGSLKPMDSVTLEPWDKLAHFLMYLVFAVLGYRVVRRQSAYQYLCVGIVVYSGLLELIQSQLPGRAMSGLDLLCNAIGVICGAIIALRLWPSRTGA